MHYDAEIGLMPDHKVAFISLKGALIEAPMPHYPDPSKQYRVYIDAWDNVCSAQLSQEHNGQELPHHISFTHIHGHSAQMKHSKTRGLWC